MRVVGWFSSTGYNTCFSDSWYAVHGFEIWPLSISGVQLVGGILRSLWHGSCPSGPGETLYSNSRILKFPSRDWFWVVVESKEKFIEWAEWKVRWRAGKAEFRTEKNLPLLFINPSLAFPRKHKFMQVFQRQWDSLRVSVGLGLRTSLALYPRLQLCKENWGISSWQDPVPMWQAFGGGLMSSTFIKVLSQAWLPLLPVCKPFLMQGFGCDQLAFLSPYPVIFLDLAAVCCPILWL